MKVTHNLRMDLARCGCRPIVGAVQGEANTRVLEVALYDNSVAWEIPAAAVVDIAYQKPDGTKGVYNMLPDGTPATSFSGNVLTAVLAPQVLTCAGTVRAAFVFSKGGDETLATFPFTLTVEANPAAGAERSEDYYNPKDLSDLQAMIVSQVAAHADREDNPHAVTAEQVGAVSNKSMKVVALAADMEYPGYGTCIVMHNSDTCLVFDLGNDDGETLRAYLDNNDNDIPRGIDGRAIIDAIYISHFHSDHYRRGTLQALFDNYTVNSVVFPHVYSINWNRVQGSEGYLQCYNEAVYISHTYGAKCNEPVEEGEAYTYGDFTVTCHNVTGELAESYYSWNYNEMLETEDADGNPKPANYNNFSMVNVVTFGGRKIVVTGDIMEPAINQTIDVLSAADIIFVPHHGLDIRFPPSKFNRLTAQHAVINAAYDYGDLLRVSRAFAGELIKKGCRAVTTHNGKMAGYLVSAEAITPVEPGCLAGTEVFPCAIKPGHSLSTLPEGEYITYSEKVAQSIPDAPPFTLKGEQMRKFKLKVEATYPCAEDTGHRTQTAYTIDTSAAPEIARRIFSGGRYHDWVITLGEGKFYKAHECASDAELDAVLLNHINDMADHSHRKIVLSLVQLPDSLGAGGHWHTEIYKQSENYAIITAKTPADKGMGLRRTWFGGDLLPWEWVDPPMYEGVEYRTTERIDGEPVYKKLISGQVYHKHGSGDWELQGGGGGGGAVVVPSGAVIVTVNGTTPSHTSQEIYALIQAGKVVYLQLWGNTYIICSACTESEAKFENSIVTTATGADGTTYNVQRFRLYFIKNDKYASPQTINSPSIEYLDAAIAHALGQ